jgi:hypothetical protein
MKAASGFPHLPHTTDESRMRCAYPGYGLRVKAVLLAMSASRRTGDRRNAT